MSGRRDFIYALITLLVMPASAFQTTEIRRRELSKIIDTNRSSRRHAEHSLPLSTTQDVSMAVDCSTRRRGLFQSLSWIAVASCSTTTGKSAGATENADVNVTPAAVVSGTVSLPMDVFLDSSSSTNAALYVTVRPDTPDNVPAAILNGTRGKPPPVMAARFPSPITFPFEFQLSSPQNLTPEGASMGSTSPDAIPAVSLIQDISTLWWANDDLIVSARWDSDGVAATRSPEDLVGRTLWRRKSSDNKLQLVLTGRGAFGKFVTGKS